MSQLSKKMVVARTKQPELHLVTQLNFCGKDLSNIDLIKSMQNVEILSLSVNQISSLAPFAECPKLQELYLRKNNIQDITEIAHLQNLQSLKYLWLKDNPCCDQVGHNYRATILRALPNLKNLDDVEVTQEELDEAMRGVVVPSAKDEIYWDAHDGKQVEQKQPQLQQSNEEPLDQPTLSMKVGSVQQSQQHSLQHSPRLSSRLLSRLSSRPSSRHQQHSPPLQEQQPLQPSKEEPCEQSTPSLKVLSVQQSQQHYQQHSLRHPQQQQQQPQPSKEEPFDQSTHSTKVHSELPPYPEDYRYDQKELIESAKQSQAKKVYHDAYNPPMEMRYPQRRSSRRAFVDSHSDGVWVGENQSRAERRYSNSVLNGHRQTMSRNANVLTTSLCLIRELDLSSLEALEVALISRKNELLDEQ